MKKLYLKERSKIYTQFIQTGGTIYTDPKTNKNYSGAGIMLFELYNDKPTVVLFKGIRDSKEVYEDLAGEIDEHDLLSKDPLKMVAIRESFEESRGLINIMNTNHIDRYIDHEHNSKYFRSYLIGIDLGHLLNNDYHHNKKCTDDHNKVIGPMKETIDIDRFYISDLIEGGILDNSGSFKTIDTNKKERIIFKRSVDIIKDAINEKKIEETIDNPLEFIQLKSFVSV